MKPLSVRNISKNISNYEPQRHALWRPHGQEWQQWREAAAPHPLDSRGLIEAGSTDPPRVKSICESSHSGLFSPACHLCLRSMHANGGRLEHTFVLKDIIITAFSALTVMAKWPAADFSPYWRQNITKNCLQGRTTYRYLIYPVVMW